MIKCGMKILVFEYITGGGFNKQKPPDSLKNEGRLMLQARAIENQAWVIGVNRVGSDPVAVYAGHSLIANPYGQIVAGAGETQEILRWELDLQLVRDYRRNLPFLDDVGTGWGRALQD